MALMKKKHYCPTSHNIYGNDNRHVKILILWWPFGSDVYSSWKGLQTWQKMSVQKYVCKVIHFEAVFFKMCIYIVVCIFRVIQYFRVQVCSTLSNAPEKFKTPTSVCDLEGPHFSSRSLMVSSSCFSHECFTWDPWCRGVRASWRSSWVWIWDIFEQFAGDTSEVIRAINHKLTHWTLLVY